MTDPFRLRLPLGEEPELRCPHCGEWWAISTEFWEPNEWHMCRACKRERAKLYQRLRQRDKDYAKAKADASRRYRVWLARTCPQYLPAYERERKARNREKARLARENKRVAA